MKGLDRIERHLGVKSHDVFKLLERTAPPGLLGLAEKRDRVVEWSRVPKDATDFLPGVCNAKHSLRSAYDLLPKRSALDLALAKASSHLGVDDLLAAYDAGGGGGGLELILSCIDRYLREPLRRVEGVAKPFLEDVPLSRFLVACRADHCGQMLPLIRRHYAMCDETLLRFAYDNIREDLRMIVRPQGDRCNKIFMEMISHHRIDTMSWDMSEPTRVALKRVLIARDDSLADVNEHHFNEVAFQEFLPPPDEVRASAYLGTLFQHFDTDSSAWSDLKTVLLEDPTSCPLVRFVVKHHTYFDNESKVEALALLRGQASHKPLARLEEALSSLPPDRLFNHVTSCRRLFEHLQGASSKRLVHARSPREVLDWARDEERRRADRDRLRRARRGAYVRYHGHWLKHEDIDHEECDILTALEDDHQQHNGCNSYVWCDGAWHIADDKLSVSSAGPTDSNGSCMEVYQYPPIDLDDYEDELLIPLVLEAAAEEAKYLSE